MIIRATKNKNVPTVTITETGYKPKTWALKKSQKNISDIDSEIISNRDI